ncbi:amidohydrolase family protein [Chloroflexota bacterium]
MKIDIFAHIIPQKYVDAVDKRTKQGHFLKEWSEGRTPTLSDLDERFRIMDKYDGYVQVLTVSQFHRIVCDPKAVEMAQIANDMLAELILKHPDRFAGAVACVPWNDVDASCREIDRAINELGFKGIEIWTPIDGKPIDLPVFSPVYEKMAQYNLPIWIHPQRAAQSPDYRSEEESKYGIYSIFGWPYDTTAAMTRLVFSHVLQDYPNLKFITHHCGALVPYFAQRIVSHINYNEMRAKQKHTQGLTKHPIEYFRMFYNDTALSGNTPALMCAYAFFGAEHMLFGTDMPFDSLNGDSSVNDTIVAIEQMDIPDSDKKKIFEDNARQIMRLPV